MYCLPVDEWRPGGSVFLKTIAPIEEVRAAIYRFADRWKFVLAAYPRYEFGMYGVRIWRL